MQRHRRITILVIMAMAVTACGSAALQSLGSRSSRWINEPTVPTTILVVTTVPVVIDSLFLKWFNDDIVSKSPGDPEALRAELFQRRGGELIVQASRDEIATLVPGLKFPSRVPTNAEYVTSQVVFDGSGSLSSDPVAGFGLWSSEPYTRSRSVAQIVVLWVAADEEGSREIQESPEAVSCARFADRATIGCEILNADVGAVWSLKADNGITLVWYDETYRYELFGRAFVTLDTLLEMADSFVPLTELGAAER